MHYQFPFRNLFCLVLAILVCGCTALQPFPIAARSGDTISLAIGSAEGMDRSNTTITFTSDTPPMTPIVFTPNIRSIFSLYPDKKSRTWILDTEGITISSNHGAWETILVADLPLGLDVGPGNITVSTSAIFPNLYPHINDSNIPIEILQGTGSAHSFDYNIGILTGDNTGDLSALEPMRRITLKMPEIPSVNLTDTTQFAGAEIKLTYPLHKQSGDPVNNSRIYVVLDERYNNLISKLQMTWVRNGDDITVMFLSPEGLAELHEIHFSVVDNAGNATLITPPSLVSAKYWDINGDEFAGPVPMIEGPL